MMMMMMMMMVMMMVMMMIIPTAIAVEGTLIVTWCYMIQTPTTNSVHTLTWCYTYTKPISDHVRTLTSESLVPVSFSRSLRWFRAFSSRS
jgi:hypothetical protein